MDTAQVAGHRRSVRRRTGWAAALGASLALVAGSAAVAVDGTLPGGTGISVTITNPADELTIEVPTASDTADVPIAGEASVGGAGAQQTTVIFVLDVSNSMTSTAGADCDGDGSNDTRRVCQSEAVANALQSFMVPGSPVAKVGVVTYGTTGTIVDLGGPSGLVDPSQGVIDTVRGLPTPDGNTRYNLGLERTVELLGESTTAVNRVLFVSDGTPSSGVDLTPFEGAFDGFGSTRIDSFAISGSVACDAGGAASLTNVAALTAGGSCTEVDDVSVLADTIEAVVGSTELIDLTVTLNGDEDSDVVLVGLPGPVASHPFEWMAENLAVGTHEVCVTARGADGSGEGTVTDCRTINVVVASDEQPTETIDPSDPSDPSGTGSGTATPATPVSARPNYTG